MKCIKYNGGGLFSYINQTCQLHDMTILNVYGFIDISCTVTPGKCGQPSIQFPGLFKINKIIWIKRSTKLFHSLGLIKMLRFFKLGGRELKDHQENKIQLKGLITTKIWIKDKEQMNKRWLKMVPPKTVLKKITEHWCGDDWNLLQYRVVCSPRLSRPLGLLWKQMSICWPRPESQQCYRLLHKVSRAALCTSPSSAGWYLFGHAVTRRCWIISSTHAFFHRTPSITSPFCAPLFRIVGGVSSQVTD